LYVTLASLGAGLILSTVRWLVIDPLHHATGVARPAWDFGTLQGKLGEFQLLVESHYRYYQFYANSLVALVMLYATWRWRNSPDDVSGWDAGFAMVAFVLWMGSRDTLRKYYVRGNALLAASKHAANERQTNA
jgi:hypothetical protein